MKNSAPALLVFLVLCCSASAQQQDMVISDIKPSITFFEGSFDDAKAKAAEEGKVLFVDAYAVWCGPCKYMNNNVFTDMNVAKFFNEHFVNYKYDMEKGEGPAFAIEYSVIGYPTLFFLDPKGKVLERHLGGMTIEQLLTIAKKVKEKHAVKS
jgi:thiol:disulfide interchange protein